MIVHSVTRFITVPQLSKTYRSDDRGRQFEAHDVPIARRQRPVDDQLQFRINLQHGERVLVHISGASSQRTLFGRCSVFREQFVACCGSIHTDEGQRKAENVGVHRGGQLFNVAIRSEAQIDADGGFALQFARSAGAVGYLDFGVFELACRAVCVRE